MFQFLQRIVRCVEGKWFGRHIFESIITCTSEGIWFPILRCTSIMCDEPPYISYASVVSAPVTAVGSKVRIDCVLSVLRLIFEESVIYI